MSSLEDAIAESMRNERLSTRIQVVQHVSETINKYVARNEFPDAVALIDMLPKDMDKSSFYFMVYAGCRTRIAELTLKLSLELASSSEIDLRVFKGLEGRRMDQSTKTIYLQQVREHVHQYEKIAAYCEDKSTILLNVPRPVPKKDVFYVPQ